MQKDREIKFAVQGKESGVNIFKTDTANPITYASPSKKHTQIRKVDAPVPGVFLLYDVLTPDECQQYINLTEKMGYEEATVSTFGGMVKMPDLRNNERVIWQSEEDVWGPIWQRIEPHIPKDVKMGAARWTPYGLNERLRFYRYDKEEMFGAHFDGCFPRRRWDMSLLTFIIYLTDDFEGGGTMFYPSRHEVRPVKGMACLFFHGSHPLSPEHEGMLVTKGRKYVLRSDVMYRAQGK